MESQNLRCLKTPFDVIDTFSIHYLWRMNVHCRQKSIRYSIKKIHNLHPLYNKVVITKIMYSTNTIFVALSTINNILVVYITSKRKLVRKNFLPFGKSVTRPLQGLAVDRFIRSLRIAFKGLHGSALRKTSKYFFLRFRTCWLAPQKVWLLSGPFVVYKLPSQGRTVPPYWKN